MAGSGRLDSRVLSMTVHISWFGSRVIRIASSPAAQGPRNDGANN